ncbi:MAG: TolC family protein, partial [Myxococcaceae bacterium]|nr:TolC family protein [Myxococcaceae bacterium]
MRLNRSMGLAVLFLASGGWAQSLGAFLQAAGQQNLDVQLSAESTRRAGAEKGQSWGALLPSLTASGGWTHNQYEAVLTIPTGATTSNTVTVIPRDQLDAQLKAEVPLVDLSKWLRVASTSASQDAAEARGRSTLAQVQRQVVNAYYAHVSTRALLESAQKSLAVAQAQLDITRSRTSAGVTNTLEVARAEAEVERNTQVLADAQALVATSGRTLRSLTGLEPKEVPALAKDDLHPEPPLEQLESGLAQLPEVEAAQLDAKAAGRGFVAASLALAPTVNAQFTQRFTNATGFQGQSALYNAGLTFNWRLDVPAGFGLQAQAAQEATAALNAEKARRAAADQLHADWHQAKAALSKVGSAAAQVAAAQRASSLAHERYAAGVATQLDVIA